MTADLSSDVLYMILDCLGNEKDFNSLYQCSLSSRGLADLSLSILYKICDASPVKGGGTEDEQFRTQKTAASLANVRKTEMDVARRWAVLWRSIISSAVNKTYMPYCNYLRYLDLNDLENLLRDARFTGWIKENFYGELEDPLCDKDLGLTARLRSGKQYPEIALTLTRAGSAIVKHAPSVRGMSCNIPPSALPQWIPSLPLLQSLTIWSGEALTPLAGSEIRKHCRDFRRLMVYTWVMRSDSPNTAEVAAEMFFNELHPHMLEYFEMISYSLLGPRSILAMGSQLNSLTELKLTNLTMGAIAELPSLTSPPALEILSLTDSTPTSPDAELYAMISDVAKWITSCKALRRLELRRFLDDAALLSEALTDQGPHLTTLSVTGYKMPGSRGFHQALVSQSSLRHLYLHGWGSDINDDNNVLVEALAQLSELRELQLKDISDGFSPDHVMSLTSCLPQLERLWISGEYFEDDIWNAFLCLTKLQSLAINAPSEFTAQGILGFIAQLGPGNRGLSLSILYSTTSLTEEAQTVIRDTLKHNLDGSLDYVELQEEEDSDAPSEIYD